MIFGTYFINIKDTKYMLFRIVSWGAVIFTKEITPRMEIVSL